MERFLDYLKKLTFKKFYNLITIETSRILSFLPKKPLVWGMPYTVSIEPTSLCNLRCPECPTGSGMIKRENVNLDLSLYEKIIDEIKNTTLHLFLYFQGEPFMNRDIFHMIRYASEKKIFTIISTNGQFLDKKINQKIIESGLNRLIISIDGADQATFQKYRVGGDLNRVLEGSKNLSEHKRITRQRNPEIIFQFLVFKHNEDQIESIKKLGKISGADRVWIKSAQIINAQTAIDTIPLNSNYSRYTIDEEGKIIIKSRLRNHCKRLWRTTVITTDGCVIPCCFDKEGKYVMGDLKSNKLSEIWHGQKYKKFRTEILINRKGIEMCNNCTEGLKVFK